MLQLKTLLLGTSFCLVFNLGYAQALKKVTKKTKIDACSLVENYQVLKSDSKVKHGSYSAQILTYTEKGQYDQGKPSGIWEFSGNTEVHQKFDFSTSKFLLDEPSKIVKKIVLLDDKNKPGKEIEAKNFYLGGDPKMLVIVNKCMKYPRKAQENDAKGEVILSATLTKEGKIINEKAESNLGSGLEEESLRVLKLIPATWVPVMVDGRPVDVKLFFSFNFTLTTT
ncbi:Gram-negative bacterial tonB protein [compost metagenome]